MSHASNYGLYMAIQKQVPYHFLCFILFLGNYSLSWLTVCSFCSFKFKYKNRSWTLLKWPNRCIVNHLIVFDRVKGYSFVKFRIRTRTYFNISAYVMMERCSVKIFLFIKDVLNTSFWYVVVKRLNWNSLLKMKIIININIYFFINNGMP